MESGEQVLIRAYGKKSDLIIDRPQELVVFLLNFHVIVFSLVELCDFVV
jgi:hypothetical protein